MSIRRTITDEDRMSLIRTRNCYEMACSHRAEWLVLTAGGQVPFCPEHVDWYRQKGPSIYPIEPIVAAMVAKPA